MASFCLISLSLVDSAGRFFGEGSSWIGGFTRGREIEGVIAFFIGEMVLEDLHNSDSCLGLNIHGWWVLQLLQLVLVSSECHSVNCI
jgi:hypothetical protein